MSVVALRGRALNALLAVAVLACSGRAWGWGEETHRRMVREATGSLAWLDGYRQLTPTPFGEMVSAVLGSAAPVGAEAFKFKDEATRQAKRDSYLARTSTAIADPGLRRFAQHLLLGPQTKIDYALGERGRTVSAREVLSTYSSEPDWGMDKGLDASKAQALMGGTDGSQTSSQGFRHMSFLLGRLGEAPARAQLFFDLGRRAIEKGHPYWGFRFVAWGLHYLEDMGAPVHTNMLPTLKYVQLKGLLRPKDANGVRHFNRGFFKDLVTNSALINASYHFLYEETVERMYGTGTGAEARLLSAAVKGTDQGGLLAPRTVAGVAKRRGWSRLSTPAIARATVRYFGESWRQPAEGAPENTVRRITAEAVDTAVAQAATRAPGESQRSFQQRLAARDRIVGGTMRQLQKNGVAIRRALELLHSGLPR